MEGMLFDNSRNAPSQASLLRPWRSMLCRFSAQAITAQTTITRSPIRCLIFWVGRARLCGPCDCDCSHVDRGRFENDGALLSTPFELIFPDDTLLPVSLALDPVLKHVA
jgi:hypothetical protein